MDLIFDVFDVDITIILTFLHSMSDQDAIRFVANQSTDSVHEAASTLLGSQNIDTHAPLILYSSLSLVLSSIFSHFDINM
jgi:hypothetical protein